MDELTGLASRRSAIEAARQRVDTARAEGLDLCALWVGIDRFQQINDSFGYRVGDHVLVEVARRLRQYLPPAEQWARVGGDEFLMLMHGLGPHGAESLAGQILQLVSQPIDIGDLRLRPSGSIGIALLREGSGALELLEGADRAMHDAKRFGGGRWLQESAPQQRGRSGQLLAREELAVEELIHEALEGGGLSLNYQPLYNVTDGAVDTVEALMRCAVNGVHLAPSQLIPVAEKTGLIVRLGEWTLLEAARFVQRQRLQGLPLRVAVNVSRNQLTAPRFAQVLHASLAVSDAPPEAIELELTESLFMDASDTVRNNLAMACEAGFSLAIDDFGTGYSCLAYLKDLPATKLKLDRAFVSGLPHDRRALAITRMVAQLGRDLGMTVVAEGVETAEQLESLAEAGVPVIQGHYIAAAMPAEDLGRWITTRT